VSKVHNKPIKSSKESSNKKNKIQLKATLVWRTGLSGVPPDSVRCTREINSELATFGNLGSHSTIIHRTIRCSTGLSGVPAEQRLTVPTVVCKSNSEQRTVHDCARRSQSRHQKAHRTVNRTCPVHHRTVRWPTCQKLQRSNPNSWVTWLAHRTVSGGAPDPSTAEFPNGHFGGWGYKYPPTTTLQDTQALTTPHSIQEQYTTL
jgi:hypothetical protein